MADQDPNLGTGYHDFVADSDIVTSRAPLTIIKNFTQLSPAERYWLSDHLRHWVKVVDGEDAEAFDLFITEDHRRRFNEKLFDGWTSLLGAREPPSAPAEKRKEDGRLQVSVWSEDLPLSGAAKRKRGDDDDDLATSEFIQWENSASVETVKAAALTQHDTHEKTRIRNFNENLLLMSARNYIVEAAKAGIKNAGTVQVKPSPVPELQQLTSTLDLLKQIHAHNARIIAIAESMLGSPC
ncbi:hypothetical protein FLAG1_02139 [Fusarium langsethiae]|uniref:Uncharacterized protein n=1 Tax=Fusarium langsethiae TaxID=179993 RepID=A0A0M9F3G1_FUSLA|nr:hypothetical protein FLAG1_02139 [Fusarium langsethiae]GKT98968.1 unnamed protein product [Fusarium langsethiae]GKU15446.1 unnamed protein product [Fusarium langsethiae]